MSVDGRDSNDRQSSTAWRVGQLLDTVVYALFVTALVFLLGVLVGVVVGGGLVTAKYVLFVVGFLVFGYASLRLKPASPLKSKETDRGRFYWTSTSPDSDVVGDRPETRLQATVQQIPPVTWYQLPPDDRLSGVTKLFVASVVILALSLVLESVFLVGV